MERIDLDGYNIYLGDISRSLPDLLAETDFSGILVLVDANTRRQCLAMIEPLLPAGSLLNILEIPPGEKHKNISTCERIWQKMLDAGADRGALLLNLGGGVIGDMGGFCAATFKRGIRFIQIPTTLLSQVDASVGGKLGIDFGGLKNSIGVFSNPQAVCIDPAFLATLPERELRSGFAEVIKHALIADRQQWETLQQGAPESHMIHPGVILRSLHIKQAIVQADPFEKGLRKALNFGHTIGHAVEALALETAHPLLHGEAVAIGMIAEAYLSQQHAGLPEEDLHSICRYILGIWRLPALPETHFDKLLASMRNDKKNAGGQINCTLLYQAGAARIDRFVAETDLVYAMTHYNNIVSLA